MARELGVVVSGEKLTIVDAEVPKKGPIEIIADFSWTLQRGDRPAALNTIYKQVKNYVSEHGVEAASIKASALTRGGARLSNLHSAELRGVVTAALADVCKVRSAAKASLSKTFGNRKVDEYVADDGFWAANVEGHDLRAGSREAAILILAGRD